MPATKENKGMDTDNHHTFTARINGIEDKMVKRIKKHYNFKTDKELLLALVKRAYLHIT